jgi:PleD family two-component response regulator
VTFSGGIATLEPSSPGDARELVARADEALYAAKRSGRNRFASWHLLDRLQPSAALSAVHGGG